MWTPEWGLLAESRTCRSRPALTGLRIAIKAACQPDHTENWARDGPAAPLQRKEGSGHACTRLGVGVPSLPSRSGLEGVVWSGKPGLSLGCQLSWRGFCSLCSGGTCTPGPARSLWGRGIGADPLAGSCDSVCDGRGLIAPSDIQGGRSLVKWNNGSKFRLFSVISTRDYFFCHSLFPCVLGGS